MTPEEAQVDRAGLLTLSAPEMTVLVGGLRVLGTIVRAAGGMAEENRSAQHEPGDSAADRSQYRPSADDLATRIASRVIHH